MIGTAGCLIHLFSGGGGLPLPTIPEPRPVRMLRTPRKKEEEEEEKGGWWGIYLSFTTAPQ